MAKTTKTDLIHRWKKWCNEADSAPKDSLENRSRKMSVENQFNRHSWEIVDDKGIIRIINSPDGTPEINAWHRVWYAKLTETEGYFECEITLDEYKELERKYFSDFIMDEEYRMRYCK